MDDKKPLCFIAKSTGENNFHVIIYFIESNT